jgi:hypothetical protein
LIVAIKIEVTSDSDVKQFANTDAGKVKAAAEILDKMKAGEAISVKQVEV